MPTALVTGATGFTGGALTERLVRDGHQVTAFVRPSSDARRLHELGVKVVSLDITDRTQVERCVDGFDRIFHIAACYREEPADKGVFRRVNVEATEHLLRAARQAGVGRFVHCSTVGVHGHVKSPPADETAPAHPNDAYQESKWEGEQIVRRELETGLPGTIVRPSAIYGPGDQRFLKLFRSIQRRRFAMIGTGKALYHLVYIDDLVDGILRASQSAAALGEVFILAGPRACTIRELVDEVARASGVPAPRLRIPLAPVQMAAVVCERLCHPLGITPPLYPRRVEFFAMDRSFSIEKARRLLGYEPAFDLPRGIAATLRGYGACGML